MPNEKKGAAQLGWQSLESQLVHSNPWFKVRGDHLRVQGRGELDYFYLEHPGGVLVVPATSEGQILLIRQYRYPVDAWCWEIPAGGLHENPDVLETARKELLEEAGASCEKLEKAGQFYVSGSVTNEICHVVLAWDVKLGAKQKLDHTEFIEIHPTPIEQALAMARYGQIEDGKSALSLLLCEARLRAAFLNPA